MASTFFFIGELVGHFTRKSIILSVLMNPAFHHQRVGPLCGMVSLLLMTTLPEGAVLGPGPVLDLSETWHESDCQAVITTSNMESVQLHSEVNTSAHVNCYTT